MKQTDLALKDLFAPSGKASLDSDRLMPKLKTELEKQSKVIRWEVVEELIAEKILEMLDVPLQGVLLSAWKKYREVEQAADSDKTQPVSLLQHTIESTHHPSLEFLFKGVRVAKIDFTVVVDLDLKGFTLNVGKGAIRSINAGSMNGNGSLAVGSAVVAEKDFGTIELRKTIDLGDGIPLR